MATPDDSRRSLSSLLKAIDAGKVRLVSGYLERGIDVDQRDDDGYTPLIRAVYIGKEDVRSHIVRLLVRHGSDVNVCDNRCKTALMHACALDGRDDVIRRIIGSGSCDPNVRDLAGNTALWYAASSGNHSAITLLMYDSHTKSALDVDCRNQAGTTPLDVATANGHEECARILASGRRDGSRSKLTRRGQTERAPYDDNCTSDSTPPGGGGSGLADENLLSLERISLHSRQSLQQPEVRAVTPAGGREVYLKHGHRRQGRLSLDLPPPRKFTSQSVDRLPTTETHSDRRDAIKTYSLSPRAARQTPVIGSQIHVTSGRKSMEAFPARQPSPDLILPTLGFGTSTSPKNRRSPCYDKTPEADMT